METNDRRITRNIGSNGIRFRRRIVIWEDSWSLLLLGIAAIRTGFPELDAKRFAIILTLVVPLLVASWFHYSYFPENLAARFLRTIIVGLVAMALLVFCCATIGKPVLDLDPIGLGAALLGVAIPCAIRLGYLNNMRISKVPISEKAQQNDSNDDGEDR